MKNGKIITCILISLCVSIIIFLLTLIGAGKLPESVAYDTLLDLKPPALPLQSVLIVDTASASLQAAMLADAVLLLKEFGAEYCLLDEVPIDRDSGAPVSSLELEHALSFFGNSLLALGVLDSTISHKNEEVVKNIPDSSLIFKTEGKGAAVPFQPGLQPFHPGLIRSASGVGFVIPLASRAVFIDGFPLTLDLDERAVPHLALAGALAYYNRPETVFDERSCTLLDAKPKEEVRRDITLPFTDSYGFLAGLSIRALTNGFRTVPFSDIAAYVMQERALVSNLAEMKSKGYLSRHPGAGEVFGAFEIARRAVETMTLAEREGAVVLFRENRDRFFEAAGRLLGGSAEREAAAGVRSRARKAEVEASFRDSKSMYEELRSMRQRLHQQCAGSLCIIARAIPRPGEAIPPGLVTAGLFSTILSGKYTVMPPLWAVVIAGFLVSLCLALLTSRFTFFSSIAVGIGTVILFILVDTALFVVRGIYVQMATGTAILLGTSLVSATVTTVRRKADIFFMKASVEGKLAPDVIGELVERPQIMEAEGEKKVVSVLASGIKGFKTVASRLAPDGLISVLREYHKAMGAAILASGGAVGLHEQDEILACFGAPLDAADHAVCACETAVRMKRLDRTLNSLFAGMKNKALPVYTRIGIMTGHAITGNIGEGLRPDFAVVGPAIDFAKQLRSINGTYGTSILITEQTFRDVKSVFTVRQLDKVRTGKTTQAFRVYELVEKTDATPRAIRELIELFHDGLYLFEKREWRKAFERFSKALAIVRRDRPTQVYMDRCRRFLKKPPGVKWDGVFRVMTG